MEPKANQGMQTTKPALTATETAGSTATKTLDPAPVQQGKSEDSKAPSQQKSVAKEPSAQKRTLEDLVASDRCLGKLHPGEPFFVLRGQDKLAPIFVRGWAEQAKLLGLSEEKFQEAMQRASEMENWPNRKLPD